VPEGTKPCCCCCRSTNGTYTAAKGDIERVLLAKMLRYLNKRDEGAKPFYIYYAPHSIHL
jgi:hypothetical protein